MKGEDIRARMKEVEAGRGGGCSKSKKGKAGSKAKVRVRGGMGREGGCGQGVCTTGDFKNLPRPESGRRQRSLHF